MKLHPVIENKFPVLEAICKKYDVVRLYLFGSAVGPKFDPTRSDLDFIIELSPRGPIARGEALLDIWKSLENLFEVKVDLLSDRPIRNPYLKKSVEQTKQLIYERSAEEVPV